jgi:hypothetical protein
MNVANIPLAKFSYTIARVRDSSQDSSQGLDQKNAKIRGIAITQCCYFIRRNER